MKKGSKQPAPVMSAIDKMIYERQRKLNHIGLAMNAPDRRGHKKKIMDRLEILNSILELNIEIDLLKNLNEKQLSRAA
jgi:hypothetical protein